MPGPRRILLVDDEPSIVKMVGKRLELAGFDVRVAMDGEEAIAKARSDHPELVILDLMLPKRNGYEVCSIIKGDPALRRIPVIMFTVKDKKEDVLRAKEVGADAYVRKPFRAEELLGKIEELLAKSP